MPEEVNLSGERLRRAVECETPDRVPITIRLEYAAARWADLSFKDFALDPLKASNAIEQVFDKMGGWDAVDASWTLGTRWSRLEAAKVQFPGVDFPEQLPHRVIDQPVMMPDDYETAINNGLYDLAAVLLSRLGKKIDRNTSTEVFSSFTPIYRHWEEEKDVQVYRGGMVRLPFVQFSMWRTWRGMAHDLLKQGEKVKAACDVVLDEVIAVGEKHSRIVGCNYIFIPCGRASATFLSERLFLEYVFPHLKKVTEKLVQDGFIPRLHCDTDWEPFLEYFLELPKRSCILELSPVTNIKRAKELLGGHMCLYGDVPMSLLSAGSATSVETYCKKLIDSVGHDGFILANDDIVPYNARFENVKMLIDAGKRYG